MTGHSSGEGRAPAVVGRDWRVVRRKDTVSTNIDVLDEARSGDPGRVWVVAERQTDGRARRGRGWTSDPGNLYASALLIDPCEARHLPELPFVVAVSARRAVAEAIGARAISVGLKWPNDLMIRGRKIAGILLETTRTPEGRTAVAVGIGINCKHHPSGTETPATNLLLEGADVYPERLFDHLSRAFADFLDIWSQGVGFAAIRDEWLSHALGIGGPIRVRLVEGEDNGIFEAIDAAGLLVLRRADGTRRLVSAGDVFFPATGGEER